MRRQTQVQPWNSADSETTQPTAMAASWMGHRSAKRRAVEVVTLLLIDEAAEVSRAGGQTARQHRVE